MKWTLVTGGAKRVGAELAIALAQQGHNLVIHYHHSEAEANGVVQQCLQKGVQAAAIAGDFSSLDTTQDFVQRYMEQFPETEHVINNVGNYLVKTVLETSIEEWMSLFQTNVWTPLVLIKALVPSLIRHQGAIINIGTAGVKQIRANLYNPAYSLTKTCLWMLTCTLASELAPSHVRVNMVSPGQLDISVDLPKDFNTLPMGRPSYCWEVSRVVAFLLQPESQSITGQNIEVAGGVGL
jgi:NAD(P)-dependent dehydrogenase (short-subunit alcohol dehydrogenase family)